MPNDPQKPKTLFSLRNFSYVVLIGVFASFILMAFPDALSSHPGNSECIDQSPECLTDSPKPYNFALWIGVFLCSLLGVVLMTFGALREKRGPTIYVGLVSAAALNTLMWMLIVYAGAFLIGLF